VHETARPSTPEPSIHPTRSRPLVALIVGVAIAWTALELRESPARAEVQPPTEARAVPGSSVYDETVAAQLRGYHDDGTLDGGEVVDVLIEAGVLEYDPGGTVMPQMWDQVPDVVRKSLAGKETEKEEPPPPSPPEPRWSWPMKAGVISSEFGRRGSRPHEGMDIAARTGEPIYAASAGRVIYAGSRMSGYGNALILHHGGSTTSLYAHARGLRVGKGDRVERGSPIATVGSTGRATGPHLHFEIRFGSRPIDPREFLPGSF